MRILNALPLVLATLAVLATPGGSRAQVIVSVDVATARPGPIIEPYIFSQFVELVGRGVHDGIWVGHDSAIPNTRGFRNDVIAAMRALHVPLLRWPGGCYADVYDWRDGIGDPAKRSRRLAGIWGGSVEDNVVGTHEFFDFAELIGAESYINGNIGSGSPRDMAQWLEYMTSDRDTTLTRERAANGHPLPYRVAVFGVGNETWGCGGNMRPDYAADLHNRYASFLFAPPYPHILEPDPSSARVPLIVAAGPNGDDREFMRAFVKGLRIADAVSLHYYTFPKGKFGLFGPALGFGEDDWASTIVNTRRIDDIIRAQSAIMNQTDPNKKTALYIDEWGTWYDATPGASFAYQQNSIRDAVVAALNLNIFMRHADRVRLSAIAQLANILQAMVLTRGNKFALTPSYYVYKMYVPFQGATFVPATLRTPDYVHAAWRTPAVDIVAARARDGVVRVSLVNVDPSRPASVTVSFAGKILRSASGSILTASEIDAHNEIGEVPKVVPTAFAGRVDGSIARFALPPKSIAVVEIRER